MASMLDYDPGSIPDWVHFFLIFCLAPFTLYQRPVIDHCPWPSSLLLYSVSFFILVFVSVVFAERDIVD
jgi:hypothetical protein